MEFEGQPTRQEMWDRAMKLGIISNNNIDFDRLDELGTVPQDQLKELEV